MSERTEDARVALVEALWHDEEFRRIVLRVINRLFPEVRVDARAAVEALLRDLGLS